MSLTVIPISGQDLVAFNHESITVADAAIGFTAGTITPAAPDRPAHRALVTAETAQMRYTYDSTTPSPTVGHLLEVGDVLEIEGISNVSNFRAIRVGATSGNLRCTFERFR